MSETSEAEAPEETEAKTGDVVKNKSFKTAGDFISEILDENCKDDKGNVDIDATRALCSENGVELKDYTNPGFYRMNAGNMLRSRARKRHGLYVKGDWVSAPAAFTAGHEQTQHRDGSPIKQPETEQEAA